MKPTSILILIITFMAVPCLVNAQTSMYYDQSAYVPASQDMYSYQLSSMREQGDSQWMVSMNQIQSAAQVLISENTVLQNRYDRLNVEIDELKNRINSVKTSIAEQQLALQQRNSKIKGLVADGQPLQTKAGHLNMEIKDLKDAHDYLRAQLNSTKKRIDLRKLQIEDLKLEKKSLDLELKEAKVVFEQQQGELEQEKQALADLKVQLTGVNEKLHSVKNKIDFIRYDDGPSAHELKMIKDENVELLSKIHKIEGKIARQDEMRQKNLDGEKPKKIDKKDYYAMVKEKSNLENRVKSLQRRIRVRQQPETSKAAQLDQRRQKIVQEIVKVDADNKALEDRIEKLKENVTLLRTQVNQEFRQWRSKKDK